MIEWLVELADKIAEIYQQQIVDLTAEMLKTLIKEVNELKIASVKNDNNRSRFLTIIVHYYVLV